MSPVFAMLILIGLLAVPAAMVMGFVWFLIPHAVSCPHCSEVTERLVTVRALRRLSLERRWCTNCGWAGLSRNALVTRKTPTPPGVIVPELDPEEVEPWKPDPIDDRGW